MGFDSVFVSDHLQPWLHEGGHAPASVPWLGALGARTSRILIGTSVLTPTFRYNPTVIAQDFATLGVMYPGRVILGVGTGEALNEANLGIPWPDPPERFQRLKEAIGLIRRLWSEERVNFDGTYYTTRNVTIYDKLDQPVPIYIGAAGSRGDPARGPHRGRIHHDVGQVAETLYTDTLLPALHEGLEKAGRAADAIDTLMEVKVSLPPRPRRRPREDAVLGAARAERRREDGRRRPASRCSGSASSCRSSARHPGSSSRPTPTSTSSGSRVRRPGLPPPRLPRPRPRPGGVPAHVRRRDPAAAARTLRPGRAVGSVTGAQKPGWAVIIPVKPSAVGKSRLELPTASTA